MKRDAAPCALGLRIKSGRAVAVSLSGAAAAPVGMLHTVVMLSDPHIEATRQPFHAGLGKAQDDHRVVARLVQVVTRCARDSIDGLLGDERLHGFACRSACIVVGSTIDPATVGNPHIRAHASEGRLFRTVVEDALRAHRIRCSVVVEKSLRTAAARTLGLSPAMIARTVTDLGQTLAPPWRADDKAAALAAWMALGLES